METHKGIRFDLSFLAPPQEGIYRCKVIYKSEIVSVEFAPYIRREIKTLKPIESDISYPRKFVDRSGIDKLFLQKDDADDILIIKNGLITDTSIANVAFLDKSGRWITPKTPLLHGTMRQKLLEDGFLIEGDIEAQSLMDFEEVAIMNALRGFESLGQVKTAIKF